MTQNWSCYDRSDPIQLREHLNHCKPSTHFKPDADRRGVPCNVYDQFDAPKP